MSPMAPMDQHRSNDTNIALPPQDLLDALGSRLSQTAIDAASWQVAQQETQRRGAEQIASLTEALQQRDLKLHAVNQMIEEMMAQAAKDPDLKVCTTLGFLTSFVEGNGLAAQIPQFEVGDEGGTSRPAADAGIDA